jgi:hypothetical protein
MIDGRMFWWPILPRILPGTVLNSSPNIKELASKRYKSAKSKLLMNDVPETKSIVELQKARCFELTLLLCDAFDITEPALLRKFAKVIILTIPSSDICFQLCCDVLSRGHSFISRNFAEQQIKLWVFRELVQNYFSAEDHEHIERIQALSDPFLNLIFADYFTTLLPPYHVMRIFDMFLLDGSIVLHRIGLGLLYKYKSLLEISK